MQALRRAMIPLAIGAITFAVFSPALRNGFVNWDDGENFLMNPGYRGLGPEQLRWMLTTAHTGHWIPVTWLTLGLDYVLWGMRPFGYHLTSLLLHAGAAVLFYAVSRRLLRAAAPGQGERALTIGAATAALFFACHPLRAESVAWVTERRDVVAGVFFLATLLAYLEAGRAAPPGDRRWRVASIVLFALALAAKAIVLPLPLILLVLDIYPLRRLEGDPRRWGTRPARGVLLEKVPYACLAGLAGAIALGALRAHGQLTQVEQHSFAARVAMAAYGLGFYLWKTVLPVGLSPLYELPEDILLLDPPFLLSTLGIATATVLLWRARRRWPAGLAAWVAYGAILLPVSLRVHVGHQLVTDRYSYFACLGPALLVGGAAMILAQAGGIRPPVRRLAAGAGCAWLVALAVLSWQQAQVWRDGQTLWRHAVAVAPDCAHCYNGLAKAMAERGQHAAAIEHFRRGLALRPQHVTMSLNLTDVLLASGRTVEALEVLHPLTGRLPHEPEVRSRLVLGLIVSGRLAEAAAHVERVQRSGPVTPVALLNLGFALIRLGRPAEAVPYLERAAELAPLHGDAHFWLGQAYAATGRDDAARRHLEAARRLSGAGLAGAGSS